MKQQRKNKHLLPAILTVLAILSSLLGILPAGSVSAADVTAYPAQAVHFGAYTTNRNLNNAGSAANTQKAAGANSEDWRIDYVSAGVYQIVSLADGKYLTANGTACTLTAKAADSNQNWNIESVQKDFEGYDLYYKITSVSTGALTEDERQIIADGCLINYYAGKKLVLINKSPTGMDYRADLAISAPIGEVFSQITVK